ncbi:MAG: penicillin-binding protein activator [Deltaproteobacteria bacterium]|nr:penicillin-binding protein activator [Deltaproteobacteria bacterium]
MVSVVCLSALLSGGCGASWKGFRPIQASSDLPSFRYSQVKSDSSKEERTDSSNVPDLSIPQGREEGPSPDLSSDSPSDHYSVGAVLPLTGKYRAYGERVMKALLLVFQMRERHSPVTVELVIEDGGDDVEQTERALRALMGRSDVVGIIGPLFSKTALPSAEIAQEARIPIIVLSQNPGVSQVGDYVFQHGLTYLRQAEALADWAIDRGMKRFAVLYPADPYGTQLAEAFWNRIETRGGQIVGAESYAPAQTDFSEEIKALVGLNLALSRVGERKLLEQIRKKMGVEGVAVKEENLSPIVDFEAIYIPDYPQAVGQIAPYLSYYNVSNVLLLGSNGWNSPDLVRRGERHVENAVFIDGFSTQTDVSSARSFCTAYLSEFSLEDGSNGEPPGTLEAYAFEALQMMMEGIRIREVNSRESLRYYLSSQDRFPGLLGPIRVSGERDFFSPLVLLTVRDREIRQLALLP